MLTGKREGFCARIIVKIIWNVGVGPDRKIWLFLQYLVEPGKNVRIYSVSPPTCPLPPA